MIDFDYHSHHVRCGHAEGNLRDYVEKAVAIGLTSFGVSDHGPAYWFAGIDHAQPQTQMAVSELPNYVAEARAVQADFAGRIDMHVGVEADYIEGHEAGLAALLDAHHFDYVLGSVHYAYGGRNVFDRKRWTEEEPEAVWRDYYRLVALAARSGLFDILSHLTVVEAYSPAMPESLMAELYPAVADAVAEGGCIVEINTSGYRKMGGDEPFPNRTMLRLLIERGVPLTFGSDCHQPGDVAWGRERVAALLRELGVATADPLPIIVRRGPVQAFATK